MTARIWDNILNQYGQDVILRKGEEETSLRAIVQPYPESGKDQEVHSPLGLGRQDRFRYLGPARHPIDPDTVVEWKTEQFRVQSAHLVGEGACPYWWAVLYPREEVVL